uniref:Uncharacterized protein n=1 Tax=Mus musculus TaxID=10090 RepID=Q8C7W1_MOUSE|nr:unnamed protein product [Mus musculus]
MWGLLTLMRLPAPAVLCAEGAGEGSCPRHMALWRLSSSPGDWLAQSSEPLGQVLGGRELPSPSLGSNRRMFTCHTECNSPRPPLPVTAWPLPTLCLPTPLTPTPCKSLSQLDRVSEGK